MRLKTLKKIIAAAFAATLLSASYCISASAADVLYNKTTQEIVAKGVTYELNKRYTTDGWMNVHALKINLNEQNISVAPVASQTEIGKKETVISLLRTGGAIAGVNADFFGMKGNYSAGFGLEMAEGEIISLATDKNLEYGEYSTFFVDNEGNPFIDFLKSEVRFMTTGENFELASVNKVTEMIYPIYFDKNGGSDTSQIDARFSDLVKLTIQNNTITNISAKGETVAVPDDGYLIILSSKYYDDMQANLNVGQGAYTEFNTSIDLSAIETAVSGAGRIIRDGEIVSEGLVISGRQPRTAIGISEDKNQIIMVVVDGRGASIGATHDELGWVLKGYGAYNAMHFDGGGSSTMAAKTIEDNEIEVKNVVSDGSERRVINSFGVFDNSTIGPASRLIAESDLKRAFIGASVNISAQAFDEYYHRVDMPGPLTISAPDDKAVVNGSQITLLASGKIPVTVTSGQISETIYIEGMLPSTISPDKSSITLAVGGTERLSVSGVSTTGYEAPLNGSISYEVSDSNLGYIENGVFTAIGEGSGYIKCSLNGAEAYIRLSVGGVSSAVTSFEDRPALSFSKTPADSVSGFAGISDVFSSEGALSLLLNYTFSASESTQAAYLNFAAPIAIPGEPSSITLSVNGNSSGHWLRGKIKDAAGTESIIDFAKQVTWSGWADATAEIPSGVKYPITLENIYVAALSNSNTSATQLCFDNLRVTQPHAGVSVPADTKASDELRGDVTNTGDGAYYITLAGSVTSGAADAASYDYQRSMVHASLNQGSSLAIYAGKNDVSFADGTDTIKWNDWGYSIQEKNNAAVIQLTASKGGLKNTIPSQWFTFKDDAINSPSKNVIFIMDRSPVNFTDAEEKGLIMEALSDISEAGKNVFVISSSGAASWSNVKNGVRYINLPDLWNADGSINQDFKLLKFKINGDDIKYDIVDF